MGAPPTPVTSARSKVTTPMRPLNEVTPEAATAAVTNAVVASCAVLVPAAAVGAVGTPVKLGPASSAPLAPEMSDEFKVTAPVRPLKVVTVVEPPRAAVTKAVVAICVVVGAGRRRGRGGHAGEGRRVDHGAADRRDVGRLQGHGAEAAVPGDDAAGATTAACTKAVVASWVVEAPGAAPWARWACRSAPCC